MTDPRSNDVKLQTSSFPNFVLLALQLGNIHYVDTFVASEHLAVKHIIITDLISLNDVEIQLQEQRVKFLRDIFQIL